MANVEQLYAVTSMRRRFFSEMENHLTALLCLLSLLTVTGHPVYGFNLGKKVTLDFHHELKFPNSTHLFIVRLDGSPYEFFVEGHFNHPGLKPGQAGRIDVKEDQSQRNVTIIISIHDVQPIDEGLYILNIFELNDDTASSHTYKTYLDVTYPPGRARCQIENPSIPSGDWLNVRCNATVGNDNTGYLMCFQNSKQVPHFEAVRQISNVMTGLFWIDPTLEVRCCSIYKASDVDVESCNDFVWPFSVGSLSSNKPDLTTNAWSSASPSIEDDGMGQHDGKSRDVVIATAISVIATATIVVCLVIVVAALIYICRKKKRDKKSKDSVPSEGSQIEGEEQPLGTEREDVIQR